MSIFHSYITKENKNESVKSSRNISSISALILLEKYSPVHGIDRSFFNYCLGDYCKVEMSKSIERMI